MVSFQRSFSLRTSPDSTAHPVVEISEQSSIHWPNAGQWTLHGGLSIPSTGSLSEDVGCLSSPVSHPSLSDILESDVLPKYYLSPRAAAGILRRAERRGKTLPQPLMEALTVLAATDHPAP